MKRYGVINPTLNADIFLKNKKHRLDWKDYILPSGKTIRIQGYENFALDLLLKTYKEEDIIINLKEITSKIGRYIKYIHNGKERKYYPDIFIVSENRIIEVKSMWTFMLKHEENLLKKQACLDMGLNFDFLTFDKTGKILKIIEE